MNLSEIKLLSLLGLTLKFCFYIIPSMRTFYAMTKMGICKNPTLKLF